MHEAEFQWVFVPQTNGLGNPIPGQNFRWKGLRVRKALRFRQIFFIMYSGQLINNVYLHFYDDYDDANQAPMRESLAVPLVVDFPGTLQPNFSFTGKLTGNGGGVHTMNFSPFYQVNSGFAGQPSCEQILSLDIMCSFMQVIVNNAQVFTGGLWLSCISTRYPAKMYHEYNF